MSEEAWWLISMCVIWLWPWNATVCRWTPWSARSWTGTIDFLDLIWQECWSRVWRAWHRSWECALKIFCTICVDPHQWNYTLSLFVVDCNSITHIEHHLTALCEIVRAHQFHLLFNWWQCKSRSCEYNTWRAWGWTGTTSFAWHCWFVHTQMMRKKKREKWKTTQFSWTNSRFIFWNLIAWFSRCKKN